MLQKISSTKLYFLFVSFSYEVIPLCHCFHCRSGFHPATAGWHHGFWSWISHGVLKPSREVPCWAGLCVTSCQIQGTPARFYFWIHKDGDNENHWPFLQVTAEPPSSAHHATEDWLDFLSVLVDKDLLIRAEEYERDHKEPGKAFITSSALCRPYIYI